MSETHLIYALDLAPYLSFAASRNPITLSSSSFTASSLTSPAPFGRTELKTPPTWISDKIHDLPTHPMP